MGPGKIPVSPDISHPRLPGIFDTLLGNVVNDSMKHAFLTHSLEPCMVQVVCTTPPSVGMGFTLFLGLWPSVV